MTATLTSQTDHSYRRRLGALSLAMLLPSLGTSIANVALPTLAAAFEAPFQDVQWVVISYLLAVTSLIVGAGRLGDMLGRRKLLLIGIAIFILASVSCVLAPNLWALVAARGVQGLGAAIMMALTIASVGDMVPKDRTGSAMGLLGTVSAVGTALGPSLGGALIAWFGWQAVFVVMAGAGGVAFLVGQQVFPADAPVARRPFTFDVAGMLLLAASLGAYALSTTLGGGAFGAINAILGGLSLIGLLGFVVLESRVIDPLVQLRLLRDRSLQSGLASMALVSTIVMATLVVGPFYLSGVLKLAPVEVGLVMSIGPAVSALTGVPAGRLVDGFGTFVVMVIGLIGLMVGACLMTILPGMLGGLGYACSLVLVTAGYALFQAANNTAVMNSAEQDRRGVTSALLGLSRNLGLITGASAMGALFAYGSKGVEVLGLAAGGESGLRLTFAIAAAFAGLSFAITLWGNLRPR
ncbi:MAG: MFS transporter [Paracoccaceae bacterium]